MKARAVRCWAESHTVLWWNPGLFYLWSPGFFHYWVFRMEKLQRSRQVSIDFLMGKGQQPRRSEAGLLHALASLQFGPLNFLGIKVHFFCSHNHLSHVRHQRWQDKLWRLNPDPSPLLDKQLKNSAHWRERADSSSSMCKDNFQLKTMSERVNQRHGKLARA